jgi:hypothetical protein
MKKTNYGFEFGNNYKHIVIYRKLSYDNIVKIRQIINFKFNSEPWFFSLANGITINFNYEK